MANLEPENMTDEERKALEEAWRVLDQEVNRRQSWRL